MGLQTRQKGKRGDTMALVKVLCNGEDLTQGEGTVINLADVRKIEQQGFAVVIMVRYEG